MVNHDEAPAAPTAETDPRSLHRAALAVVLAIVAVMVLRTAWVADDAFITLRTVRNFAEGYGPVWNVGERVQSYTHPAWMFLMTGVYLVVRAPTAAAVVPGVVCTLSAVFLMLRRARPGTGVWVVAAVYLGSRSMVDFGTSGLENPLSHLLLVMFAGIHIDGCRAGWHEDRRRLAALWIAASFMALTRLDLLAVAFPALCVANYEAWKSGTRPLQLLVPAAVGLSPLVAWEIFSLVYYGLLVPNTAVAKLGMVHPPGETWRKGFLYLYSTVVRDPVTAVVLVAGLGYGLSKRDREITPLAVGGLLYLVYTVKVGGDFMLGRFLTVPATAALLALVWRSPGPKIEMAMAAALVLLGLGAERPVLGPYAGRPKPPAGDWVDERGVADEAGFWFNAGGLADGGLESVYPDGANRRGALKLRTESPLDEPFRIATAGYKGYLVEPERYAIDEHGLSDAFLAQLPNVHTLHWRAGHGVRHLPKGYEASVASGDNEFENEALGEQYLALRRVIRGPLFGEGRWATIWRMNTGTYRRELVGTADLEFPRAKKVELDKLPEPTEWEPGEKVHDNMIKVPRQGARIDLGRPYDSCSARVTTDAGHSYVLAFVRDGRVIHRALLPAEIRRARYPQVHEVRIPRFVRDGDGFDRLHVAPIHRGKPWRVGHVELIECD